ncbi:MAG: hypothetical protein JNJ78_23835, partial [Anaerolineae bacterium]|nr:hypothetical protein [Anaerolineae bacterium]
MENLPPPSSPRTRWLALIAAVATVLVGGVVALWSRRRRKNIDLPERGDSLERP